MIRSFGNKMTEDLFHGRTSRQTRRLPQKIHRIAVRKLDKIHQSGSLETLRYPPGNHLESLKGNYKGKHSIRINEQWRVVFRWEGGHAFVVAIVDYH